MAIALSAGDIVRCGCWSTQGDQAAVNTFHFVAVSVGALPMTDADVAAQVSDTYSDIIDTFNTVTKYNGCEAQIIFPLPVKTSSKSTVGSGFGAGTVANLPRQTAGLTAWYTNVAGRHGRGRTYWPFPAGNWDDSGGVPTAAYVTLVDDLAFAILGITAISAGGRTGTVALVLHNRVTHTSEPITQKITRPKWATQRKRGSFGRPNASPV